jgi:hypothetical protein
MSATTLFNEFGKDRMTSEGPNFEIPNQTLRHGEKSSCSRSFLLCRAIRDLSGSVSPRERRLGLVVDARSKLSLEKR